MTIRGTLSRLARAEKRLQARGPVRPAGAEVRDLADDPAVADSFRPTLRRLADAIDADDDAGMNAALDALDSTGPPLLDLLDEALAEAARRLRGGGQLTPV